MINIIICNKAKSNNLLMKFSFLLTFLAMSISSFGGKNDSSVDYQKADSIKVMSLFNEARTLKSKTMPSYMLFFARELKGLPYVGKTLEKNKTERLVVNLRQLDCTTYVETVLALARSMEQGKPTFSNYCNNLRLIRYKDGIVSYPTRQHYFTYWIRQNCKKGIVKDIQGPNPPFSVRQTVKANYMTTHLNQYPMLKDKPQWVKEIGAMEKSITGLRPSYIPKSAVNNTSLLRKTIHDGDIIAIVTKKAGLEISHLGIAAWHKDGLHMLNASSLYHKVVEDNNLLKTYLYNQKSGLGIRVVRPQ